MKVTCSDCHDPHKGSATGCTACHDSSKSIAVVQSKTARQFNEDEIYALDVVAICRAVDGRPFVIRVIKEPADELNFANAWHSDLSYLAAPPSFTVRPQALAETFLQDCDPEIQRQAMDKTARQSLAVLEQPVQSAAWRHVPSTYLVCAQDQGTPANLQREFAGRAARVVELDAGHHPFLSQPAAVRDLIVGL